MIKLKLESVKGKLGEICWGLRKLHKIGLDTIALKEAVCTSNYFSISNSKQNSGKIGNPKDQFHLKAVCKSLLVLEF